MAKRPSMRERILDIAEEAVLAKGFSGTSIDEIIAEAGITKSGFFYHFSDKNALARALLQRYIDNEDTILNNLFARARDLHGNPLHSFLIALKLLSEVMADLPRAHPGCLVAVYVYSERMFDREVRALNQSAVAGWRARFLTMFEEIAALYPPREPVDLRILADMVSNTMEGGIVISKALGEPMVLAEQVLMLRTHIRLLFLPVPLETVPQVQ